MPQSTFGILNLNVDCLLQVFGYLSPLDMCAVKDTCLTFSSIAERSYYKSKELVVSDRTIPESNKMFYKFCAWLTNLDISVSDMNWHHQYSANAFSTIRKCNPQLKSLTLTDTDFSLPQSRLQKTFPKLRKIKPEYFDASVLDRDIRREVIIKDIFKACKNVEEISFGSRVSPKGYRYDGIFLQQKFKKLQSLELYKVCGIDINSLKIFLKLNPNLKRITLKNCVRLGELSAINFVKNSPDIEGISVSFDTLDYIMIKSTMLRHVSELCDLKKLKSLALDTRSTMVTDFIISLAQRNSLGFLCLTNVRAEWNEGLAKALSKMNNLTILRLHIIVYASEFKDFYKTISTNLVNLIELHLMRTPVLFQQICDIVENSVKLKKLYLKTTRRELNDFSYLLLVKKRLRKNAAVPLTLFLYDNSYAAGVFLIPNDVLQENRHIIKLEKVNPTIYDDYWLPTLI